MTTLCAKKGAAHVTKTSNCSHVQGLSPILGASTQQNRDVPKIGKSEVFLDRRRFQPILTMGNDTGPQRRSLDYALCKATQLQQATNSLLEDLISALHIGNIIVRSPASTHMLYRP